MPFPYDGERCIDDFVMLTILCGNDFIPNLPSLDIGEGALDQMLSLYRDILPTLGGYLVEEGTIHFERLETFTAYMGTLEAETFKEREREAKRFERRNRGGGRGRCVGGANCAALWPFDCRCWC